MIHKGEWTAERRALQAQRIRESRSWKNSTGPKTAQGKKKSSRNAFKHGAYAEESRAINRYLAASRLFLKAVKSALRDAQIAGSELERPIPADSPGPAPQD